ncbi:hypothetical protein CEXT_732231 [Caerostris extrusa]|uniref:Uncharacterized protein n=1 Tax=Caerostris extrusa TaxID=172846 RepID=A0AAV4Y6V5_CAEEX|nr:hypothetical protein CEXT_732231 [Caerostris extrusa]
MQETETVYRERGESVYLEGEHIDVQTLRMARCVLTLCRRTVTRLLCEKSCGRCCSEAPPHRAGADGATAEQQLLQICSCRRKSSDISFIKYT